MSGASAKETGSDLAGAPGRDGFDTVASNPPFQSQLRSRTAFDRGLAALLKVNSQGRTSAYTDAAAVFLDASLAWVRSGGSVAMLLPQSVLSSRDAAAIRCETLRAGSLEHVWISGEHAFDGALVATWAPVLRKGAAERGAVTRTHTLGFSPLPSLAARHAAFEGEPAWGRLISAARGVPAFGLQPRGTLADIASATADFRDEYYGLAGFIVESAPEATRSPSRPPIVTSGLIDPAVCRWGQRKARIHKKQWLAPAVDRKRIGAGRMAGWLERRLVPKILLAVQTRTLEVFADEEGVLVPCLPLISVLPHSPMRLWHIASALASPVATAWALDRYAGTALTGDAIKLAARQVLTLPLPADGDPWDRAAAAFRAAQQTESELDRLKAAVESGRMMCDAYGLERREAGNLIDWWCPRLTKKHRTA